MHLGMCLGIGLNRVKEEVFYAKIEDHAKQDQGRAQHAAVPECQANAQPLEDGRPCLS